MLSKYTQFLKDNNMKIIRSQSDNFQFATPFIENKEEKFEAHIVEGNKLEAMRVQSKPDHSAFSFFLDGIERTKVLTYHPTRMVPVIYGYISAAILQRTDKKMYSSGIEEARDSLYLPYKDDKNAPENYFDLEDFAKYPFMPQNIGTKDVSYPILPAEFERKAHSLIQEARRKMERDLAKTWMDKKFDEGWLFIDGRLEPLSEGLKTESKAVGVIKSHQVSYFDPEDQIKIYKLEKGERSSVFQPAKYNKKQDKMEKENVYCWYLRLHSNNHRGNADFGLVRIEIPAKQELIDQADLISSWILLETNPVAFPASRWDRMIYPIKFCEDYLKSKAPSYIQIESVA